MVIFDCNGVLVDGEPLAAAVAAEQLARAGVPLSAEAIATCFFGRRPSDMVAMIETATGKKLPAAFPAQLAHATVERFRSELRPVPHALYALTWLRGPKCVASSSPLERIRVSLETTGLIRFFESALFSASDVARGKPAPDLFLLAAKSMGVQAADCIVVEDSPVGVKAAKSAGMLAVGFVGGSHAGPELAPQLMSAGASTVVADLRHLKSAVVSLRGW